MSGDPVSWLMIEPGWRVLAADGGELGKVVEVAGDDTHDIFDGLSVAPGLLGRPLYIPAEAVAEIREGEIRLSLGREELERLDAADPQRPRSAAQARSLRQRLRGLLR